MNGSHGYFDVNGALSRFVLAEVHDVADNVGVAGWHGPDEVDRYFRDCKRRRIELVGWRLSICGDFLHHSHMENSPLTPGSFQSTYCSDFTRKFDFLALGATCAKRHGIRFFPYVAMSDEGWFPRFRFLSRTVEEYYKSEGFEFLLYDDDYALKPGFHSLHHWLDDPEETEKQRYAMTIPAVEQGQHIPRQRPWSFYTRFARAHPEFASQTKAGFRIGRHLSYAHPEVRDYRIALLKEIAACGCDGFILDYTRWSEDHDAPVHDRQGVCVTGYDEPTKALFKEKYGRTVEGVDNADPQWIQCRAEASHTRFLMDLRRALPDKAVIAKLPLNDPLKAGFMDVTDWATRRLVDAVFVYQCQRTFYDPCTIATSDYPTLCERHHKSSLIEWTKEWIKMLEGTVPLFFYPWTRVHDEKDQGPGRCRNVSERELYEQVRMQKRLGLRGTVLYQNYNGLYYHPVNLAAQGKSFEQKHYAFDESFITLHICRKGPDRCLARVTFAEPRVFLPDENRFLPKGDVVLIVDGSTVFHRNVKDSDEVGIRSVEAEFSSAILVDSPHRIVLEASSFGHRLEKVWQVDIIAADPQTDKKDGSA